MGWWWSSDSNQQTSKPSEATPPPNTLSKSTPQSTQTSNPQSPPRLSNPLTRDEQAEADLQSLLSTLSSESAQHSSTRAALTDGSDIPSTFLPTSSSKSTVASRGKPQESSLYPTSMSCRQTFDSAFYCQSLGGQFNNIYRYGELRSCSEHWSAFWFCMRTKSQPEEKRSRMIQEHYRQRDAKYKLGPSSEDVWQVRTEPVEGAFERDPDEVRSS